MPRIDAKEVQITLANGKVLHFIESEGDTVVVQEIRTAPSHTPHSHPLTIHYYTITVQQAVDRGRKDEL